MRGQTSTLPPGYQIASSRCLPTATCCFTLRDVANHVMGLPKTESALPHWQLAVECLMAAAEKRGLVMMARIAVVKALTQGQAVARTAPQRHDEIPDRRRRRFGSHKP